MMQRSFLLPPFGFVVEQKLGIVGIVKIPGLVEYF